ncbi:invasion associated locus B family protein [Nitratireductor kimnyeongensis]|uniref:Invasion associated locus B family protein n=1 Tax=Nitratireductor kimnyeongensis TaxID=430679 RepID=A0ABW0T9H2_9HYPH|nr:invasion associated locus B family protein [Nitratireductor kimnyeongensis]QZZ35531.1 invasion associated locus B family protein [Nitratireductor kimnyeongensis]
MKSLNAKAIRTLFALAGAACVAASGAGVAAAQQQQPPQGWFKACTKQEDVDICNVQNVLVAETGQMITGVSLIEVKGKVNRKVFQITVPTGRMVPPGIGLQIDGGQTQKIDYAICLPDRCIAEAPLTDQLVASFKRGSELTLTSVNFQNQPNPIKMTLSGFTNAFDGDPLPQSDIEDRQKKLQDFVNKNNEEFTEKLREAQEKAKKAE